MRIAINAWFWSHLTTGSGQYTRQLIDHVAAASDLTLLPVTPAGGEIPQERPTRLDPHKVSGPTWLPAKLSKVWFEQVAFPRACRRLDADVAHVPYWAPPLRPPIPTIVTIHDLIPLLLREYRGGAAVRLYTALVSATAERAALVLTDSAPSRRDILTHLRLPAERVRVVPLAAGDRYRPEPDVADEEIHTRYDLPERYILYLGGFDVRKNVDTAIGTYRWAGPAIGEECPLVVAGRLPDRDSAFAPDPRRLAREQDIDERWLRFIGFVDEADKPALYRGAVAFLFPSRYEGFGLPPLEALACGTPVVGSDAASIPEVVGDAGVLLPPDDAQGMAGALIHLVVDEKFRTEMSRRALERASRFTWKRTAQLTLNAYKEALLEE